MALYIQDSYTQQLFSWVEPIFELLNDAKTPQAELVVSKTEVNKLISEACDFPFSIFPSPPIFLCSLFPKHPVLSNY